MSLHHLPRPRPDAALIAEWLDTHQPTRCEPGARALEVFAIRRSREVIELTAAIRAVVEAILTRP